MHANSLRVGIGDIPTEYRDQVERLTIALLRAYDDPRAFERADKYLTSIYAVLAKRRAER